ncbi:hypothetical protein FXO37_08405 [Capsicum annuum]|nr:hypothetical protein FXO37_08405 [Capsicum annuum]
MTEEESYDVFYKDVGTTENSVGIEIGDFEDSDYFVKGSDESSDDGTESKNEKATNLLRDDNYESDVHEEVKQLRAEERTYISGHNCDRATRNYLCNIRFLAKAMREDVFEQPNIKGFKLQQLMRKKFKLHVVPKENKNTWSWVFSLLQNDLGLGDGSGFTIMSNMQKGLDLAVKELLPGCEERRKNLDELSMLGKNIVTDLLCYDKEYWCKGHNKRGCPMKRSGGDVATPKPGLPSRRIVSTGPKQVMKSAVVSGDIGFKPSSGLKWKGKQAITTRRLQQIRDQSRPSNNATMHASSSSQLRGP